MACSARTRCSSASARSARACSLARASSAAASCASNVARSSACCRPASSRSWASCRSTRSRSARADADLLYPGRALLGGLGARLSVVGPVPRSTDSLVPLSLRGGHPLLSGPLRLSHLYLSGLPRGHGCLLGGSPRGKRLHRSPSASRAAACASWASVSACWRRFRRGPHNAIPGRRSSSGSATPPPCRASSWRRRNAASAVCGFPLTGSGKPQYCGSAPDRPRPAGPDCHSRDMRTCWLPVRYWPSGLRCRCTTAALAVR